MTSIDGRDLNRMRRDNTLLTVPNALSVFRGFLGPIVMMLITSDTVGPLAAALVLMLIAELTDFIDGIVARRFNQESRMGRLIDPICDSIYHLSVFLAFLGNGWMPAWMLFVIYARDLAVPYIRTFARQAGHELPVRASGKIKTAVHAFAQIAVVASALGLLGAAVPVNSETIHLLLLVATGISLYSLLDYALAAGKLVKGPAPR
jgi:CDP-diacylglycerol---glycerol-3-phosphate 3-phosphatidyltransferase